MRALAPTPSMMAERTFDAGFDSVGDARHFCERTLHEWGVAVPDAPLVVSELASNAVVHAGSTFTLGLTLAGRSVRVEVTDQAPGDVHPARPDPAAMDGRGLFLVDTLAERWGCAPATPRGKTVWAVLPCDDDGVPRPR